MDHGTDVSERGGEAVMSIRGSYTSVLIEETMRKGDEEIGCEGEQAESVLREKKMKCHSFIGPIDL